MTGRGIRDPVTRIELQRGVRVDTTFSINWFKFVPCGTKCVHADRCSSDPGHLHLRKPAGDSGISRDAPSLPRQMNRRRPMLPFPVCFPHYAGGWTCALKPARQPFLHRRRTFSSPLQRLVPDVHALEPAADVGVVRGRPGGGKYGVDRAGERPSDSEGSLHPGRPHLLHPQGRKPECPPRRESSWKRY